MPSENLTEFLKIYQKDIDHSVYTFLTDYKIPNQFGTFTSIYERIVTVNRLFMKDVENFYKKNSYDI